MKRLASLLAMLIFVGTAWADIRYISPAQSLQQPPNQAWDNFGEGVAIDGGYIIVIAANADVEAALLYRRDNRTGQFVYRRTLQSRGGVPVSAAVAMKNDIAAIRFGSDVSIYQLSGGDYVRGSSAAPLQHPGGVAISGRSVLVGGDDCDDDAVVYGQGADGNWGITGRLDDHQGPCQPQGQGLAVDLNYDYALVRVPSTNIVRAWRRNGSALDWVSAGTVPLASDAVSDRPVVLEKSTAVAPGNYVFRRSGNTWTSTGRAVAANFDDTQGNGGLAVVYRDGVMLATEAIESLVDPVGMPYAYVETQPGKFEHAAILQTNNEPTRHHDVSGRTVAATTFDNFNYQVEVFNLPAQLLPPAPIANDFEQRDISGFTFSGGQFALAKRGINDVLTQSDTSGLAVALLTDSNWTDTQRVEADIAPNYRTGSARAGLVARYSDANNFYALVVYPNNGYKVYKRVNGVDTPLFDGEWTGSTPGRASFEVDGDALFVTMSGHTFEGATDSSLTGGRAGLATWMSQADFDNVHVAGTERFALLEKDFTAFQPIFGRDFTETGGNWKLIQDPDEYKHGFSQLDPNGSALAVIGTPTESQEITTTAHVDTFNSAHTDAWFGLLARYQDPQNYYYAAIRSNGEAQIRKMENGVISVLDAGNFTAQPGQDHNYRFDVVNDQLQLFVDDVMLADAHDGTFAHGQYGLATRYTAATWENFNVFQP